MTMYESPNMDPAVDEHPFLGKLIMYTMRGEFGQRGSVRVRRIADGFLEVECCEWRNSKQVFVRSWIPIANIDRFEVVDE